MDSTRSTRLNTCRLCGAVGDPRDRPRDEGKLLLKYGTRHYAHAECALERWGASFFDRLGDWQLERFPDAVAVRFVAKHALDQARTERLAAAELARRGAL